MYRNICTEKNIWHKTIISAVLSSIFGFASTPKANLFHIPPWTLQISITRAVVSFHAYYLFMDWKKTSEAPYVFKLSL